MRYTLCSSLSSYSLAGVSRSVTLVVAYIMTVTGLGWQEALAAVRAVRPCAGPNLGFQRQLQEFEATQADEVSPGNRAGENRVGGENIFTLLSTDKLFCFLFFSPL